MVDVCFTDPRLAAVYDVLDGDRDDLDLYLALAAELDARSVLDVGCGTGEFAVALAARGIEVTGVDPAAESVALARGKPFADRVRWLVGSADVYDGAPVDLITMTANVAQVFISDDEWHACLTVCHRSLAPGGHLVFETRDPAREAWRAWTPARTLHEAAAPDGGRVSAWCEVTSIVGSLVSFRWTYTFDIDGAVLISDSTLRFRARSTVTESLERHGFRVEEVRDAPDRPGAELVFLARRGA